MLKQVGFIVAVALLSTSAFAEEKKAPGSGPNPYADCGIGAAIFQDVAWAAATSNVIWDIGVTAITSAVSSPETCNAKKVATARLILETLPNLEQDIAIGGGVHLAALNRVMQCKESAQASLNKDLRNAYAKVVVDDGYSRKSRDEKAVALFSSVKSAVDSFPKGCDIVL